MQSLFPICLLIHYLEFVIFERSRIAVGVSEERRELEEGIRVSYYLFVDWRIDNDDRVSLRNDRDIGLIEYPPNRTLVYITIDLRQWSSQFAVKYGATTATPLIDLQKSAPPPFQLDRNS